MSVSGDGEPHWPAPIERTGTPCVPVTPALFPFNWTARPDVTVAARENWSCSQWSEPGQVRDGNADQQGRQPVQYRLAR